MNESPFIQSLLGHTAVVGFGGPPSNLPKVPIPPGYRRAKPAEITKPVLKFAQTALSHALPVGKKQTTTVTNPDKTQRLVMALTEVHWDNHPPRPKQGFGPYQGPEFAHPGISILVPDFQASAPKKKVAFNPFPTQMQGFPTTSSENIYAGEPGDLLEAIFRRALVSFNHQAVLEVAQGFRAMGEHGKAQVLFNKVAA